MFKLIQRTGGWRMMGALALCGIFGWAGCQYPPGRLNAPPQGPAQCPPKLQDEYTYMNDNALLAEMSMSPAHFVPGRADLNGSGLRRLNRYSALLREYPGDLRYDGPEADALVLERLERIRAYLVQAGVDPNSFKVERGLAGNDGVVMHGDEAVAVRDFSTFSEKQASRQGKGGSWESTSSAFKP